MTLAAHATRDPCSSRHKGFAPLQLTPQGGDQGAAACYRYCPDHSRSPVLRHLRMEHGHVPTSSPRTVRHDFLEADMHLAVDNRMADDHEATMQAWYLRWTPLHHWKPSGLQLSDRAPNLLSDRTPTLASHGAREEAGSSRHQLCKSKGLTPPKGQLIAEDEPKQLQPLTLLPAYLKILFCVHIYLCLSVPLSFILSHSVTDSLA